MKIYVRGKEIKLKGLLEYLKDIGYSEERFVGGSLKGLEIKTLDKKVKQLCICDEGFDVEKDAEFIATSVENFDTVWDKLEDEEQEDSMSNKIFTGVFEGKLEVGGIESYNTYDGEKYTFDISETGLDDWRENTIEKAVKKQNEDLLTFFTKDSTMGPLHMEFPEDDDLVKYTGNKSISENLSADSDVYDEEGYTFHTHPESSEEQKKKLEEFKHGIKNAPNNKMEEITVILRDKKEGYKESKDKLKYELDWNFIQSIAERMAKNKGKYEPYNWKKPIDIESLKQSLFRHVIEVMEGNYKDDGRDLGHLEAIALNAMFIFYNLKHNK